MKKIKPKKKNDEVIIGNFSDYFEIEVIKDNAPPPFNSCMSKAKCKLCGYEFKFQTCGALPMEGRIENTLWDFKGMAKEHLEAGHIFKNKLLT